MITRCCICRAVRVEHLHARRAKGKEGFENWAYPVEASREEGVTTGYCPDCARAIHEKLDQLENERSASCLENPVHAT